MRLGIVVALLGVVFAQDMKPQKYEPKEYPGIEAWLANLQKDLHKAVVEKLQESAGNWREVADAFLRVKKDELPLLAEMVKRLDALDLLQAKADWLVENLRYAIRARKEAPWKLDDKTFVEYVLPCHLRYTHFSSWRKVLYERLRELLQQATLKKTALAVNRYIAKTIKRQEKRTTVFGWWRNPVEVLRSGRAFEVEARGFCIALLRALGVPSRSHRSGWVEFFDGKEWLPLYPFKPENFAKKEAAPMKQAYEKPGTLIVRFRKGKTPLSNFASFSINKESRDGLFDIVWHPFMGGKTDDNGKKEIKLPPGRYHLIAGVRNRNGDAYIFHKIFKIESGKKVELDVDLAIPTSEYREEDWVVRRLPDEAKQAEFETQSGKVKMAELLAAKSALLYIFNLKNEPSVRMLPLVCRFLAKSNVEKAYLLFIGKKGNADLNKELAQLKEHPPVAFISVEKARRLFKLPYHKKQKRFKALPAVLLFKQGRLVLWSEGYDLNIESVLEAAMRR